MTVVSSYIQMAFVEFPRAKAGILQWKNLVPAAPPPSPPTLSHVWLHNFLFTQFNWDEGLDPGQTFPTFICPTAPLELPSFLTNVSPRLDYKLNRSLCSPCVLTATKSHARKRTKFSNFLIFLNNTGLDICLIYALFFLYIRC